MILYCIIHAFCPETSDCPANNVHVSSYSLRIAANANNMTKSHSIHPCTKVVFGVPENVASNIQIGDREGGGELVI